MLNNKGFTLAELMIVVAIMGLLSALGGYTIFLGSTVTSEDRGTMISTLNQAHDMSLIRAECVVLDVAGTTVTIKSFAPDAARTCLGPFTTTPTRTIGPIQFGTQTVISKFSNGTHTLTFNPTGGLTPELLVTFDLTDGNQAVSRFRIYPAIGQIRVL